ncbi:MAG: hypothetical protein V1694_09615 [Candidatus Eisenbacteria bacterium]
MLSHDQKEICVKITDKREKQGLRTKNAVLRGYPSVIFCTAGLKVDEQEATRFILLSPETTQVKIRLGIEEAVAKEADPEGYFERLNKDPRRQLLIRRIEAIREERISAVRIPDADTVRERFLSKCKILKPRYQRDVKRVFSLVKSHAVLNLWHRESPGDLHTIVATQEDIEAGLRIWEEIALCQELNIPPYIFQLFTDVIVPCYKERGRGLTRKDILQTHYRAFQRPLPRWVLDKEIIPMLEMAGLITLETDPDDARLRLIVPVLPGDETLTAGGENGGESRVG